MPNPNQVIVTPDTYCQSAVHGYCAHHRVFPEVQGGGESAEVAALRLAEQLSRTLDNAPSDWRRSMILEAIEDVRAFAENVR